MSATTSVPLAVADAIWAEINSTSQASDELAWETGGLAGWPRPLGPERSRPASRGAGAG